MSRVKISVGIVLVRLFDWRYLYFIFIIFFSLSKLISFSKSINQINQNSYRVPKFFKFPNSVGIVPEILFEFKYLWNKFNWACLRRINYYYNNLQCS